MKTWEEDEMYRAVDDVICILENVNINDLAFHLVKESPELADQLSTALGFELMDNDINTKGTKNG